MEIDMSRSFSPTVQFLCFCLYPSTVQPLAFDGKLSLNRISIETGRTHQIRVHLAHLRFAFIYFQLSLLHIPA